MKIIKQIFHNKIDTTAYVGNSAAAFDERERTTIFSVELRRLFEGEKDWSWSFVLNFWFFFFKKKERGEVKFQLLLIK